MKTNQLTIFAFTLCIIVLALLKTPGTTHASVGSGLPDEAIPVYCLEARASTGSGMVTPNCYRSDTRSLVMPVPTDYRFAVTDVVVNRNGLATSGTLNVSIGRAGTTFPTTPQFDFSGKVLETQKIEFTSPYVVLQEGERLGVYNGDSNALTTDIFVSGYLIPVVTTPPTAIVMADSTTSIFPPVWFHYLIAALVGGLAFLTYTRLKSR